MVKKYPTAVEQQDNFGWTPVHCAAHFGLQDVINLFLTYRKSSAYKKDKEGMSAFHLASKKRQVGIMEELITFCPDICESSTSNGQTALHVAVTRRQKKAVDCLLKEQAGSNVGVLNKKDTDGNTPLHLAAILEDYEILSMLLNDKRLEGNAVNKDGLTAMNIILSCKELQEPQKSDIVAKLRSVGGFPSLKEQLPERTAKMPDIIETTEKPRPQSEDDNKEDKLPNKKRKKFWVIPESLYVLGNPKNIQRPSEVDLRLATLIATITFAAAFQVPGRYESDGPYMGLPILRHKFLFKAFTILDSLALGFSTSSIFLHFLAVVGPNKTDCVNYALIIAHVTTYCSMIAMVTTFISAASLVWGNSGGVTAAVCAFFAAYVSGFLYIVLAKWVDKVSETK
ncbi:Ankyrin repeat-containing protein [Morus notabilis]|uniref:Ankyrin repeat-containing protein n=1 Tax=Morus notabilis TaxID=981085 RepID=W9RSI2_9ROSA|nr:ankyrin repeat-containing protein At2g01680 [Morus notabilis]EXB91224.1 Ankyrin repeat-containing protein [Morus notabilis]